MGIRAWLLRRASEVLLALLFGVLIYHTPASAENRALLIGVSGYKDRNRLEGPSNDVPLMRDRLLERGFTAPNIRILADGVPGGEMPTRAAILSALADLAQQASRGDFIYVQFSGHGAQQPEVPNYPRPKGVSQVILPLDVGEWNSAKKQRENAITDHEFGEALSRIRARGAFVFAVVDSCYSGTMTRASETDPGDKERLFRDDPATAATIEEAVERARTATPQRTDDRLRGAEQESDGWGLEAGSGQDAGGVGFFATQSDEPEIESKLPPGEKTYYGLFTFALAKVLAEPTEPVTYRQVAQRIAQIYTAWNRRRPMPLAVGNLDAPLFGSGTSRGPRQWRVAVHGSEVEISAGRLHGLEKGAILAILKDPRDRDDQAIGYLRVTEGSLSKATAQPASRQQDRPATELNEIPQGAYARLVETSVDLSFAVARPPALNTASEADRKLLAATTHLEASPEAVPSVRWVESTDSSAQTRLLVRDGRLYFLPASGEIVTAADAAEARKKGESRAPTYSIGVGEGNLEERMAEVLRQIARVHKVMTLAGEMKSEQGEAVRITLDVKRAVEPRPTDCNRARHESTSDTVPAEAMAKLRHCDRVSLRLANEGSQAVDVTVLYVDSAYGITSMFPADSGESNRINGSQSRSLELNIMALDRLGQPAPTGRENVLVFAVPVGTNNMERVDFSFLAQPALILAQDKEVLAQDEENVTRGDEEERPRGGETPAAALRSLLDEASPPSRAAPVRGDAGLARTSVRLLTWDVQPEKAGQP